MTISKMASADRCFDENNTSYIRFIEMMDSLQATMLKPKRKELLTESDKQLIDAMIDSRYEYAAKEQAVRIAKTDSRLAEILSLDERYGSAVKAALGEVSENE